MVNKYYPPHLGGIEFHMRDLAEALATREHVQVSAIVSNESSERAEETINGVSVTRLPRAFAAASTPVAPGMRSAIRSAARGESPSDLFHLHFPYPWGEVAWLQARTGVPTVLTYHSDIVRQKLALAAYRPWLERVLDRVDLIIASSPNMVEHSEFLNPRADKCRIIPFGIHTERFDDTSELLAHAEQLRQSHARPIVLFVGRLVYYKGADVLVRAMEDVDADLVIVGTGPLEGELREFCVAHSMSERVTFLGPQSDSDLAAWYRAADVFCLPSVARSEAFGLVQIEAHAAGTPVVSTDLTTGVPFANEHGVSGLTVPVGDVRALAEALNRLVGDAGLRERLGAQARQRARTRFSVGRMTEDTLDLYAEAIERGTR